MCDFFERLGPQGPRSYCIDNFYDDPCAELKMLYYPDVDPDDLWGFHGTTDPKIIDFVNRHHENRPVVKPNGELIIYPKDSSGLPPSESPGGDQALLAENNVGLTDNTFGPADDILGPADSIFGPADSTFGSVDNNVGLADDTFGVAENLFDPGDANDVPVNYFLDDYS